jgi:uncharacterized protein YceK
MHVEWKKVAVLQTLCLLLMLAGCATMVTQFDEKERYTFPGARQRTIPQIYSGTAANLVYAKDIICETTGAQGDEAASECCFSPFYFIVDIPLSFVGDTLLLPYTIPKQIQHGSIWKSSPQSPMRSHETKKTIKIENKKSAAPR